MAGQRSILFSASMALAVLAGYKTQTRRVVTGEVCPYGLPGDRLLGREGWRTVAEADALPPRELTPAHRVWYEADGLDQAGAGRYRPGMFMPRWASRISLVVVQVRVERLQDISEADAIAEGIERYPNNPGRFLSKHRPGLNYPSARAAYADLWDSINGPGSWATHPLVWAITFERAP